MKAKVDKILAHGINCFVNRNIIYNYSEQLFADAGVMAIELADFEGVERLALVTGVCVCVCARVCVYVSSFPPFLSRRLCVCVRDSRSVALSRSLSY